MGFRFISCSFSIHGFEEAVKETVENTAPGARVASRQGSRKGQGGQGGVARAGHSELLGAKMSDKFWICLLYGYMGIYL